MLYLKHNYLMNITTKNYIISKETFLFPSTSCGMYVSHKSIGNWKEEKAHEVKVETMASTHPGTPSPPPHTHE